MKKLIPLLIIGLALPFISVAAVARDNTNKTVFLNSGCTTTCSFVVTSTANSVLILDGVVTTAGKVIYNVQYNGVDMTTSTFINWNGGAYNSYTWYIPLTDNNPHNVTWSTDAGTNTSLIYATIYTGASVPDASSTGTGGTVSLNTVTDNSWVHYFGGGNGASVAAGSNSTLLCAGLPSCSDNNAGFGTFDSNGVITPAGTYTGSYTISGGSNQGWTTVTIPPAATPTTIASSTGNILIQSGGGKIQSGGIILQ